MRFVISKCHLEWNDFFSSSITPITIKNYSSNYTIFGNQNVYFAQSIVIGLSNKVIYYNDANSKLLVESCKFEKISSDGQGTVIHFSKSGECVQNKICANDCKQGTSGVGSYSFNQVTSDDKSISYILESSIVNTIAPNGYETLCSYTGEIKLTKNNLTDSDCSSRSCFYLNAVNKKIEISYMIFRNNIGRNGNECFCNAGKNGYQYSYCDILANQCPQLGVLTFYSGCQFNSCNIVDNIASTNYLIYMYSGSISTSSCYIYNPRANSNYNANPTSNLQSSVIQPIVNIGCQPIIIMPNLAQISCKTSSYSDKSIYKIIAILTL